MFKLLLYIPEIIAMLYSMEMSPVYTVMEGNYTQYTLRDSSVVEVLEYADSALVVQTVCAPICSSVARVYNKENNAVLRVVKPACGGVFPFAWIENGTLRWRDNTEQMLDEQEKKK